LTPANLRRPIAFALMPAAVVLIAVAAEWQSEGRWVIALGAVVWGALALATTLPREARPAWRYVVRNWRGPLGLALVLSVGTAGAVLVAIAEGAPDESSWSAAFFVVALLAYLVALCLYEFGTYRHRNHPVFDRIVGPSALVWPVAVYVFARVVLGHPFVLWVLLVALVPPVGLWVGVRWRLERVLARDESTPFLRLAQTTFLVFSGLAMLGAALRVPVERRLTSTSDLAAYPLVAAKGMTKQQALATYSPVLRLTAGERWRESSVDAFVADSQVIRQSPCRQPPRSCGVRAIPGDTDGDRLESDAPATGILRQGVEYPRVVRLDPQDRSRLPAAIRRTRAIVEYWLFYPFDKWTASTALGRIVQDHPADWEHVDVGFDGRWRPLFVAYSEHCKGVWRVWSDVPVVSVDKERDINLAPGGDPTHPFVIVAKGSHANYPTTGSREPDWAGCAFHHAVQVANAFGLVGYAADARESTPTFGAIEIPAVAPLSTASAIFSRRWWWGDFSDTTLGGLGVQTGQVGIASPIDQLSDGKSAAAVALWPHDRPSGR
jgi:hypothetical protein